MQYSKGFAKPNFDYNGQKPLMGIKYGSVMLQFYRGRYGIGEIILALSL